MAKARNPNLPQQNAGQALYGALDIELMPDGTAPGDMMYWDGVQWNFIRLIGGGGLDITYNADSGTVEIYYADNRTYGSFTADATLKKTTSGSFTADAVLV